MQLIKAFTMKSRSGNTRARISRLKWLLPVVLLILGACSGQSTPYVLAADDILPDFLHGAAHRVRESYRFAVTNPDELAKYPCYCGCGAMGHKSNLDCYIQDAALSKTVAFDTHAAGCGICVDITQDVMRLLREGKTSPEIRAYIDATYSSFGPGTNTPLPVG